MKPYRVLVADDMKIIRTGIGAILKNKYNFEIIEGENGEDAFERFLNEKVDFIMTDIKMPIIDGLEFIKNVRDIDENIPIVVISGYGEFEYAQRAIDMGVSGYILKPIEDKAFDEIIYKILKELEEIEIKTRYKSILNMKENNNQYSEHVNKVKQYIDKNYYKNIVVKDLAKKYNVNYSYLSSLFKKEVGESIVSYLTNKRLNNAKELLENTSSDVSSIAEIVGYMDIQYFYKIFKKNTGLTPSEYRNQTTKKSTINI